jgi:uncharacterized protein (TIGR02996 family)
VGDSEREAVEAQIAADPDHPESYLVLADLLLAAGDPRGELIVMQHRLATGAADRMLRVRAQKLVERQQAAVERAAGEAFQTTWRLGYLRSVTCSNNSLAAMRALFAHPSARFVTDVHVTERLTLGESTQSRLPGMLATLAALAPPCVRRLRIDREVTRGARVQPWQAGDLEYRVTRCGHAAIELALPALVELDVRGRTTLHELDAPTLQTLFVSGSPVCAGGRWRTPALRSLDWHGANVGAEARGGVPLVLRADYQDLLGRELPALRELTLRGILPAPLASDPRGLALIAQLDRLCTHESGLGAFAAVDWRAFAHLDPLIVQCESDVPGKLAERLPRAIWIHELSTSRDVVGFDRIKRRKR